MSLFVTYLCDLAILRSAIVVLVHIMFVISR